MSNLSMYSYSWDFQENGVLRSVKEFKEIGLNSVTLACSYHAGKFLRPKSKINKVYFPEDGTIYFQSNQSKYGVIKPILNSAAAAGAVLNELCDIPDLSVNAWIVLLHNSKLGASNLNSTVHNAFDDTYLNALCPSAPDAREYAIALIKDVTDSYEVDGVSIESVGFPPYEHGFHHEMSFVKPNKWLSQYLGLCFCRHCMTGAENAGVDAVSLKVRVAKNIDDYLSGDIDFPEDMADAFWLADIEGDVDIKKFLDYRKSVVTSLITEIRSSVRTSVEVSIIPSVSRPTGGSWYEGSDLRAISEITGVIEACFYEPDVERIKADLVDIKRRTNNIGKIKGVLRPAFPDLINERAVIDAVMALWDGGVRDIGFYNYGHLRSQSLKWITSALKMVA